MSKRTETALEAAEKYLPLFRRRYSSDVDAAGGDFYVGFTRHNKCGVLRSDGVHEY